MNLATFGRAIELKGVLIFPHILSKKGNSYNYYFYVLMQFCRILNSTAIDGEKIAKENQWILPHLQLQYFCFPYLA
jgi:hypothetical protein